MVMYGHHWPIRAWAHKIKGKTMVTDKNGKEIKVGDKVTYLDQVHTVKRLGGTWPNMVWANFSIDDLTWVSGNYVEVYNPSPVRETTIVKKEIIPGQYGRVFVSSTGINVSYISQSNKTELAEVIKTLQTIHDAME